MVIINVYNNNSCKIGREKEVTEKYFFDLILKCDWFISIYVIDSVEIFMIFKVFEKILLFLQGFEMVFNNLLRCIEIKLFRFVLRIIDIDFKPSLVISKVSIIPERIFFLLNWRGFVRSVRRST